MELAHTAAQNALRLELYEETRYGQIRDHGCNALAGAGV